MDNNSEDYDSWFNICEFLELFSEYISDKVHDIFNGMNNTDNKYIIQHPDFIALLKQISHNIEKFSFTRLHDTNQHNVEISLSKSLFGLVHEACILLKYTEKTGRKDHAILISLLDQLYALFKTLKNRHGVINSLTHLFDSFIYHHINMMFSDSLVFTVTKSYRSSMLVFMILFLCSQLFSLQLDRIASKLVEYSKSKQALVSINAVINVALDSLDPNVLESIYSWTLEYIKGDFAFISVEEMSICMDIISDICKFRLKPESDDLVKWVVHQLLEREISTELTWKLKHLLGNIFSKKQEYTLEFFAELHSKLASATRSKYILYESIASFAPAHIQKQIYVPESVCALLKTFYPENDSDSTYNSPLVHACFNFVSALMDCTINFVPWADILVNQVFSNTTMNISLPASCDLDCCILIETFLRKCLSRHGKILFPQMVNMNHDSVEFLLLLYVGKEFDFHYDSSNKVHEILTRALNSKSFDFAILAFSFISNSKRQKRTILDDFELSWAENFIKRYWKSQNPQHRQKVISIFQSFSMRITKRNTKDSAISWLRWWFEWITYGFSSQVSYQWSIISCSCLQFIYKNGNLHPFNDITSEYCIKLLPMLFSPFEETRSLSMECLSSPLINPFNGIIEDKKRFVDIVFSYIVIDSLKSIRPEISQGGAYLLYLIYINHGNDEIHDIIPSCVEKTDEWPIEWLLERIGETIEKQEYAHGSYSLMALFFAYRLMMARYKTEIQTSNIMMILDYIIEFVETVKPYLTQQSPETGNVYDSEDEYEAVNDRYKIIYLWRSVKEACQLFVDLILTRDIFSHKFVSERLTWFRDLMLSFRHLGSFLSLVEPMNKVTSHLAKTMNPLLSEWVDEFFKYHIYNQNVSTTRRSAGLPFFIRAIMQAICCNDPNNGIPRDIIDKLIEIIVDQHIGNTEATVHSLNILKLLFKDQKIYSVYLEQGYIFDVIEKCCFGIGFRLGIDWRIRNSATSLFTCLQSRLTKSLPYCYLTMNQYESRYGVLLDMIERHIDVENHYLMFPVLGLVSKFIPLECSYYPIHEPNIVNELRKKLRNSLLDRSIIGSSILHIRSIASKAFLPLIAKNEVNEVIGQLLDLIILEHCTRTEGCCNKLHGILMILGKMIDSESIFPEKMLMIDEILLSECHCSSKNAFICALWLCIRSKSQLSSFWSEWALTRIKTKEYVCQNKMFQLAIQVLLILNRDKFITLYIETGIMKFNEISVVLADHTELFKHSHDSVALLVIERANKHDDSWITLLCSMLQSRKCFINRDTQMKILQVVNKFFSNDRDLHWGKFSRVLCLLACVLTCDFSMAESFLIQWMDYYWMKYSHTIQSVTESYIHFIYVGYYLVKWMQMNHNIDEMDQSYSPLLFRLLDCLSAENEAIRVVASDLLGKLYLSESSENTCIMTADDAYYIIFKEDKWLHKHPELGFHELERLLSSEYPDVNDDMKCYDSGSVFRKEKMNMYRDFHLNQRALTNALKMLFHTVENSVLSELYDRIEKISDFLEKEMKHMDKQIVLILMTFSYDLDCFKVSYLKDLSLLLEMYKSLFSLWAHKELLITKKFQELFICQSYTQ